jgi:hypothetical protein
VALPPDVTMPGLKVDQSPESTTRGACHADSPVDGGDAGNVVLRADPFSQESISDLPREHGGVLTLVVGNRVHYKRSRYFGFASADDSRLETPRLVISASPKQPENGFILNLV